jgi:putative transposase
MARPLRLEFAGALYHVTARGEGHKAIFGDDADRRAFLDVLGTVVEDFNWLCHAYCLMRNHYDLLVETPDGNLAKGMRQLNGVYTQRSNRRHRTAGHILQGRYKAIVVEKGPYLLEVCRYMVLNPVRARLVKSVERWPWSSYRAMAGAQAAPAWLSTQATLARLGRSHGGARYRYRRFVSEGLKAPSPWQELKAQIYLGNRRFVTKMQAMLARQTANIGIPRAQRRGRAPSLARIAKTHPDRNRAILAAHDTGEYSYAQIAQHFGVHFTTVGRIVRAGKSLRRKVRD